MTIPIWYIVPVACAVLTAIAIPIAPRLLVRARGRSECPHCGVRTTRTIINFGTGSDRVSARAILYRCRNCGGAMRYARRSNGSEYWEAVGDRSGKYVP